MRIFRRRKKDAESESSIPTSSGPPVSPMHLEVQAQLPAFVEGSLSRWRRRAVRSHLKRCEICGAELERQNAVTSGLDSLEAAVTGAAEAPPEGLLASLLEQAESPGVRARAAVPVRGAVSGARPGLSVVLLLAAAAAGTAAGYGTWRVITAVRNLLRRS